VNTLESISWTDTQQRLKQFVLRKVRDRAVTDDIVQDVFLKAHAKLPQLRDHEKIIGWIFQITRNTIADYFRNKARTIKSQDIDWENKPSAYNDCVSKCLSEMLLKLPTIYREALQLAELENISQTELAWKLGISYSGAKSRVQRARQLLKNEMEKLYLIKMDAYGNVIVCRDRIPQNCVKPA